MPTRMAIVAMGRYGGYEIGYGSDADVMFVHEPLPDADPQLAASMAQAVANDVRRLLSSQGRDPSLEVDTGLRPEGKQGPLVRTLDSYAAYYGKWSAVWEAQALLRAAPVVGDPELCARFRELIDPLRFPERGPDPRTTWWRYAGSRRAWTPSGSRAGPIRPPTSSSAEAGSPTWSGPCSCCRWSTPAGSPSCAPPRRSRPCRWRSSTTCSTSADADGLAEAWRFASRARNATVQVRGKPSDQLPARRPGAGGGGGDPAVRAGAVRRDGQRLPAGGPTGAGDRRTGCSGHEEHDFNPLKSKL